MRSQPAFAPKLTLDEAIELAQQYDASKDHMAEVAGAAIRSGDFSRTHLLTISKWKAGERNEHRIESNGDLEIRDILNLATLAETPRAAIAVLRGLNGVDVPVASAIMTVIHPKTYTILDFRALNALGNDRKKTPPPYHLSFYLEYLGYCTRLAKEWNMTLRMLDRALWQWSKPKSMVKRRKS